MYVIKNEMRLGVTKVFRIHLVFVGGNIVGKRDPPPFLFKPHPHQTDTREKLRECFFQQNIADRRFIIDMACALGHILVTLPIAVRIQMVVMYALLMTSEPDHLGHNLQQMCQKKKEISAKKPGHLKRVKREARQDSDIRKRDEWFTARPEDAALNRGRYEKGGVTLKNIHFSHKQAGPFPALLYFNHTLLLYLLYFTKLILKDPFI